MVNHLSIIEQVRPISLVGRLVRLEPLSKDNLNDLLEAGNDPFIWQWMPYGLLLSREAMAKHIDETLARQELGTDCPFAVLHQESRLAIGCTRYLDIQVPHSSLEIGGTWYATAFQRTGVNTECKYLLLRHAFEALDCLRVQSKTDLRNERSQKAIERIGALREGILRENITMPDGYQRSTVVYSILKKEWPGVKEGLEGMMDRIDKR
jgi:RimJ/RimL family protein N-acetyltransferase